MSVSIIIPAAGLGHRMKSYGPKALIGCANDEPLICRQIRLCRERFDNPYIVVVLGFNAERIKRVLPKGIRVVINKDFATTNVAYSIYEGLCLCPPWLPLLILYGDLVFKKSVLEAVSIEKSSVLIDTGAGRENEVGVTTVDQQATYFSYGLPTKWAQIATLMYHEHALYTELMIKPHRRNHFGFEILNDILKLGGNLETIPLDKSALVEVDSSRDIAKARAII